MRRRAAALAAPLATSPLGPPPFAPSPLARVPLVTSFLLAGPLLSPAAAQAVGPPGGGAPPLARDPLVVDHPAPAAGAGFGQALAVGDLDGDGSADLAIAAPGEEAVYLAFAGGDGGGRPFDTFEVVASPFGDAGGAGSLAGFGQALALLQLDGDAALELAVGSPFLEGMRGGVVLVDRDQETLTTLVPGVPGASLFGARLAVGDFDGDGLDDLAVGAPQASDGAPGAGRVELHRGPLAAGGPPDVVLVDPAPVANANFGRELAVADLDGDGRDDLVVTAIGNTGSDGTPLAGQVFVFPGPVDPGVFVVLEDPTPDPDDPPRFGMSVAAGAGLVAVGAPRKDTGGVVDTGIGYAFHWGGHLVVHQQPAPATNDILGYRSLLGDVLGDRRPDLLFVSLQRDRVFAWEAGQPGPPLCLTVLPDSGDHFALGAAVHQLDGVGREELVLGDPTYDRPNAGKKDDVGRVVVYRW